MVVIAGGWPLLIDATARININDVGAPYIDSRLDRYKPPLSLSRQIGFCQ